MLRTLMRGTALRARLVAVFLFALFGIDTACAQIQAPAPDTILINAKLVVYDGAPAQALAVRNGRIAAIGDSSGIRALAGPSTRVIDLGGRTVIPGLIDSHIHAIRAGLSYTTEVHWSGVRTLKEALDRIRAAAKAAPRGSWLVVAGGVSDPGGYNTEIPDYQPLFQVWRERGLTLRVRYSLSAPRRDRELEDFKELTQVLPMGFGDDWLRFNGIGENVTWGLYNNDNPSDAQKEQLYEVLRWAVSRGMTATFHWHNDRPVNHLLQVLARVNAETPIAKLRWSVAHLNDASPETLKRLQTMGVGWLLQNAFYFRGEAFLGQRGAEAARLVPPLASALRLKLPVGGGTDAHRVMAPNPFVSLQWMLDGKTISGVAMRAPQELPTRIEALRLYTQGSAWFSFEENARGALAVGQLADLAVLSRDYLSVPIEQIGGTVSLLTMVGWRIVYADGPYAALEEKPR